MAIGALELAAMSWGAKLEAATLGFVLLLLGALIVKRKSRTAAVFALALAGVSLVIFVQLFSIFWSAGILAALFLAVLFAAILGGSWRSAQGTFALHRRYIVTRVRWANLVKLWIVVVLYTLTTALLATGLVALIAPDGEPTLGLSLSVVGLTVLILFLGCLRWLPLTRKLAILRNETDEIDALLF